MVSTDVDLVRDELSWSPAPQSAKAKTAATAPRAAAQELAPTAMAPLVFPLVPVPVVVGAGLPLPEEAGEVFDVAGAPPETLGVPTWGVAVATAPTPPVLGP